MYPALQSAHSGLRWIVLLLLLFTIANALFKWRTGKAWTGTDKLGAMFAMTAVHLQFILGVVLYFVSPKVRLSSEMFADGATRFYTMEHAVIMIVALVIITIGYGRAKRAPFDVRRFRLLFLFYLTGLLLIVAGIPWPFRGLGGGWY